MANGGICAIVAAAAGAIRWASWERQEENHVISVEAFFTRHGRDFTAGQVKRVARDYAAPLAIYTHGEIMMTASREQNERSLGAFHATMVARGLKRSVPRVVAIGLPRKGRMSVRVDWRHEDFGRRPDGDQRGALLLREGQGRGLADRDRGVPDRAVRRHRDSDPRIGAHLLSLPSGRIQAAPLSPSELSCRRKAHIRRICCKTGLSHSIEEDTQ